MNAGAHAKAGSRWPCLEPAFESHFQLTVDRAYRDALTTPPSISESVGGATAKLYLGGRSLPLAATLSKNERARSRTNGRGPSTSDVCLGVCRSQTLVARQDYQVQLLDGRSKVRIANENKERLRISWLGDCAAMRSENQ